MHKGTLLIAAAALAFSAVSANAQKPANQKGGASTYAPSHGGNVGASDRGRESAPGQQMLNDRTKATAPGHSYDAPGQKKIRARTN